MNMINIGIDSEYFAESHDHKIVPVTDKIMPYTKDEHLFTDYGSIHRDNASIEVGTLPTNSFNVFERRVTEALDHVENVLNEHNLTTSKRQVHSFSNTETAELPEDFYEIGCNPVLSWYRGDLFHAELGDTRGVGGHIHMDCHNTNIIPLLDGLVTLPVIISLSKYNAGARLNYYTLGGFREKEYGLEYVSLPSGWTQHKPLRKFVWDMVQKLALVADLPTVSKNIVGISPEIPRIIYETPTDEDQATDMANMYGNVLQLYKHYCKIPTAMLSASRRITKEKF